MKTSRSKGIPHRLWLVPLAWLVFAQGCAFVHTVRHAGVYDLYLKPQAMWISGTNEMALECRLKDRHKPDVDLGTRFVVAPTPSWSNLVAQGYARRYGTHPEEGMNRVHIDIPLVSTQGVFVLIPPDARRVLNPGIPNSWEGVGSPYREGWFEYPFGDETLRVQASGMIKLAPEVGNHTKWWHYPTQVLVIPALALDVVTGPLQVWWVLNEFNKQFQ